MPIVEMRGLVVDSLVYGFDLKLLDGSVKKYGHLRQGATPWLAIPGPTVGIHWKVNEIGYCREFGLIVGDQCQPKYFHLTEISFKASPYKTLTMYF